MNSSCNDGDVAVVQRELIALFALLRTQNRVCFVVSQFLKIQRKHGGHVVYAEFEKLLYCLLMARKKCTEAENVLKLVPSIVIGAHKAEIAEMVPSSFCSLFFEFIFKTVTFRSSIVRYRSLQLLSTALYEMAELSIQLQNLGRNFFDRLKRLLLMRSKDRDRKVRSIAAVALGRIQQPEDADCPAVEALLFLLRHDGCSEVRLNALKAMKVNHKTLPGLLESCKDFSAVIRREAYKRLVEIVHPKYLTVSQRCDILKQGLNDDSGPLRNFSETTLLDKWLDAFGGNIISLLNRLEVISRTSICEQLLRAYFKHRSVEELVSECDMLDNKNLPKVLTSEFMLYWRVLVDYVKQTCEENITAAEKDSFMSQLLPSVVDASDMFASYVENVHLKYENEYERVNSKFNIAQLADLIFLMDLSESAGRDKLKCTIEHLLLNCGADMYLINKLIGMHYRLTNSFDETSDYCLNEIMAQYPSSEEYESLEEMELAYFNFAKSMNAALAERLLCILCELFSLTLDTTLKPSMKQLLTILVYPLLEHEQPLPRSHAMRAVAIYALECEEYLHEHWKVLQMVVEYDGSYVAYYALKGIFDLALRYGFDSFVDKEDSLEARRVDNQPQSPGSDGRLPRCCMTNARLVYLFKAMLGNPDSELSFAVAEGLCKVMLYDRFHHPELLMMLMSRLFNPSAEDNPAVRQCVGTFLPSYAFMDSRHQEAIVEVFVPLVRSLCNDEKTGELNAVGLDDAVEFLVKLTSCVHLHDSAPGKNVSTF
uniref:Cnd3 domain-containing protein n=1 Tax=Trichuris muris TaxID=70415 RepID=A0A5S6QRP9_TRIMR